MLKEPKAKQWWVDNEDGEIVYVGGFDSDGDPMIERKNSECEAYAMDTFIAHWHHEPDCTGFDWVRPEPEVPIESPDDLVIQDRVPARVGIDRCWWTTPNDKTEWSLLRFWPVEDRHTNVKGMKHGDCDGYGCKMNLCCRRADLPPLESPDDWVTQDVVEDRPGIDQWRWASPSGSSHSWLNSTVGSPCYMHGTLHECGDKFEVRCRRKDLPKPPQPEPKKIRVELRLWVNRFTGEIVHDSGLSEADDWHEVLFDSTGQPYYLKD